MNEHTKITRRESFSVLTITREDVNYALGLPLKHKFGMGFSDTEMTTIAKRLGEANAEIGGVWAMLRDIVDTALRGEL
jgi:hypothetical protein